jgi:hypothetical protein
VRIVGKFVQHSNDPSEISPIRGDVVGRNNTPLDIGQTMLQQKITVTSPRKPDSSELEVGRFLGLS